LRILDLARDPDRSLTYQMIQCFNLGSRAFAKIYRRDPWVETASLLSTLDRPALSESERKRLRAWAARDGRSMVIVTNRPSNSPSIAIHTPEAEIGVEAAGMGGIPFVAAGGLAWAAEHAGLAPGSYLKPSPVHMLAGMLCALGSDAETAIRAAVELAEGGPDAAWDSLRGSKVEVFEDAPKGIRSARRAADLLLRAGVEIDLRLTGITESPAKAAALEAEGASVFPSLSMALERVIRDA
jgi:hypothetical protein